VAEPGDYRLDLSLRPPMRVAAGSNGFDLGIARLAKARVELAIPADAPAIEVPSACGGVSSEKDSQRVTAELGPADRLIVRWQDAAASGVSQPSVDADQLTWMKIQPGSVLIAAKFKLRVTDGQLRHVQLAVDPRLRLLPLPGDDPPSVQVSAESGQTRLISISWPRPISDQTVLEATFLFNGASAVGNIRLPQIELLDVQTARRWMAVSVDPALDSREQQGERLEAVAVDDFLKAWGPADLKPQAAYRLPAGESGWILSTRPHEPSITADQTLVLSYDQDGAEVFFDARLSVASGYVFQHGLTAPKGMKIERVSVMQDDVDRVQRWSQDPSGHITVFLNGPVSGAERLSIRGQLPIRLGEKVELPTMRVEKCQIHSAAIHLFERPAVSLTISRSAGVSPASEKAESRSAGVSPASEKAESRSAGVSPASEKADETPSLHKVKTLGTGRLVKSIAWNGLQQPPVTISVRPNRANGSIKQVAAPVVDGKSSTTLPSRNAQVAAAESGFVRLADVTLSRQADGMWCGAATFDLEPAGAEELDLRLPGNGELVQATVEGMPLGRMRIGSGVWRVRLASSDVRQQIAIIFQGIVPETDAAGRLRFESPTLGKLPVRQTFWTLLLPPTWKIGEPDGAAVVGDRELPLPRPKNALGIGSGQSPQFFVSGEGEAGFALDCHEVRSHRWPAAAGLLLLGTALAGLVAVRKNRKPVR
jgi:hypothetical protein